MAISRRWNTLPTSRASTIKEKWNSITNTKVLTKLVFRTCIVLKAPCTVEGQSRVVRLRVVQKNQLLQVFEVSILPIASQHAFIENVQDGVLGGMMETNISDRICGEPKAFRPRPSTEDALVPAKPFEPPVFGVTFIGTSHGFDAKGNLK